jgi:hypothetical protein
MNLSEIAVLRTKLRELNIAYSALVRSKTGEAGLGMPNIIWNVWSSPGACRRNGWCRLCSSGSLIVYVLLQYDVPGKESRSPNGAHYG